MLPAIKTFESPCRNCEHIDRDKEECAKECARLHAFQAAILRRDEINIKNFQIRRPYFTRKAV